MKGITDPRYLEWLNNCSVFHVSHPHHKSMTSSCPTKTHDNVCIPLSSCFKNFHFYRINSISSVVCCQVLHLCFQATQFCNICMTRVSSSLMSVTVTVFSFTYHLFSWRLTTNDFQIPYYFHTLSLHWIWNLHYMKTSVYYHILCDEKNLFS